ncbi:related to Putative hydrolase C777.06c [Melanopsichium pennsylvanicum]|uniref:Metallo-beta-lactamase family protein n=2 Tax=Melanopsichium pennsylvanicum TaxID=63383 RepID=A0A077RBZ6_9BASI|nr:metallo-beta-lactamase family protein [Melanopsichium pennsylvanicum 4]SNX86131.1 related to Putative hydrolase C777.06c [Melanopsichium pennsylvanicum]
MATNGIADTSEWPSPPSSWIDKVLFLGTGTSGQVPAIHCVTKPDFGGCAACKDAAINPTGKNRRGCTAAAVIGRHAEDTQDSTILIDCGKTFYSNAIIHFPRNGIRSIRAVLLTHAHADAILGLDDLRAWTMGGVIQRYVDIYLTQECMTVVEGMFPYLVDRSKSTGGGDVPTLRWNIIDRDAPFVIQASEGRKALQIWPLPVLHGYVGRSTPFWSLGFRIDTFSYISDCHKIPATTIELMRGSQAIVMDALKMDRHLSHFSFSQALSFFASFSPPPALGLLTDFTHRVEHHATQKLVDTWREGMLSAQLAGKSKEISSVGEGGGLRWWSDIWDEEENEFNMTIRLKEQHPAPDKPAVEKLPHLIPPIRLSWDGLVVRFAHQRK